MEKRLLKKLTLSFFTLGIILIFLFSLVMYGINKHIVLKNSTILLNEINDSYENSKVNFKRKFNLYKEDYLNRIYATDFILKNNSDMHTNDALEKISTLMGFESINVLNVSGEVVLSTEEKALGQNILDHEEGKAFWGLIDGSDPRQNVMDIEYENNKDNTPEKIFLGVKSSLDDFSIIHVEINGKPLYNLKNQETITDILKDTPTTYETAILALDGISGKVLGKTESLNKKLKFQNLGNTEDFLTFISPEKGDKLLKINGNYYFSKSKLLDNMVLLCLVDVTTVFYRLAAEILSWILLLGLIFLAVIFILKRHLKTYVFQDIKHIENSIKKIISGKLNESFHSKNPEMQSLIFTLNHWKDNYRHKTCRMSKIISDIDSPMALYECSYYIQANFFSDNLQEILGINSLEWNEIKSSPRVFESYINGLLSLANRDGLIHINNRYLLIKSYTTDSDFFGVIIDKSQEVNNNKKILQELKKAKIAAEMDTLTNLFNRKTFEDYVKNTLRTSSGEGIMLIFDLDNFKQINDNLGHPEGDKVLKIMSSFLKKNFRKDDIIARLGGDEFVVFLNSNLPLRTLESKIHYILNNLRREISYYYENYQVSVSIGVSYVDSTPMTYEDLYKKADEALYKAKNSGKNTYHIYQNTSILL